MKPDEIETAEEFAAALMRLRQLSGLTREQVVEETEALGEPISVASVTTICTGASVPRPYYLRVFLRALGIEGEDEHEAWQRARERVLAKRRKKPVPIEVEVPADLRLRRIEEGVWELRQQLARMEGMLLALAREWGIGKRDA